MSGGGFLGSVLSVVSFFVPALAPIATAFNVVNSIATGNPLGALMGGFSFFNGLGGSDFGGIDPGVDAYGEGSLGSMSNQGVSGPTPSFDMLPSSVPNPDIAGTANFSPDYNTLYNQDYNLNTAPQIYDAGSRSLEDLINSAEKISSQTDFNSQYDLAKNAAANQTRMDFLNSQNLSLDPSQQTMSFDPKNDFVKNMNSWFDAVPNLTGSEGVADQLAGQLEAGGQFKNWQDQATGIRNLGGTASNLQDAVNSVKDLQGGGPVTNAGGTLSGTEAPMSGLAAGDSPSLTPSGTPTSSTDPDVTNFGDTLKYPQGQMPGGTTPQLEGLGNQQTTDFGDLEYNNAGGTVNGTQNYMKQFGTGGTTMKGGLEDFIKRMGQPKPMNWWEAGAKGLGALDSMMQNKKAMGTLEDAISSVRNYKDPNADRYNFANQLYMNQAGNPMAGAEDVGVKDAMAAASRKAAQAGQRGNFFTGGGAATTLADAHKRAWMDRMRVAQMGFGNVPNNNYAAASLALPYATMQRNANAPIFDAFGNIARSGIKGVFGDEETSNSGY